LSVAQTSLLVLLKIVRRLTTSTRPVLLHSSSMQTVPTCILSAFGHRWNECCIRFIVATTFRRLT
jgi:hypothetical protein